jgi:hypothetical protein
MSEQVAESESESVYDHCQGEFFYPEYGGDMFLRDVGSHKIHMAPHLKRLHSSK